MKFSELKAGQLARIPRPLSGHLAPAVEVVVAPAACRNPFCDALDMEARDVETGEERFYHRRPDFEVILITPAVPAAEEAEH